MTTDERLAALKARLAAPINESKPEWMELLNWFLARVPDKK